MLKNVLLVQLVEAFVKCIENRAVSEVDYSWNKSIVFDINCDN